MILGQWWLKIRPYQSANCKIDGGPCFLHFIMRILTHKERYEMQPNVEEPPVFINLLIPVYHPHRKGPKYSFARRIPDYATGLGSE